MHSWDGQQSYLHTLVPLLPSPVGDPCEARPPLTQDRTGAWAHKPITCALALKLALHPALGGSWPSPKPIFPSLTGSCISAFLASLPIRRLAHYRSLDLKLIWIRF